MAPVRRKKNSGPAMSKTIIPRTKPEHVTIDPVLEQKLFDAYQAVTIHGQSIRQAAKNHGTSRTTLTKYLYGERKNKVVAHEYEMSLNVTYENELENYIKFLSTCSDFINKKAVYSLANQLLELNYSNDQISNLNDNSSAAEFAGKSSSSSSSDSRKTKVSQSWISKFFKRHPQLSHIKPIVFQKPRINDSYPSVLQQWFDKLGEYYQDNQIQADQIYNVSEFTVQLQNVCQEKLENQHSTCNYCKVVYDSFKDASSKPGMSPFSLTSTSSSSSQSASSVSSSPAPSMSMTPTPPSPGSLSSQNDDNINNNSDSNNDPHCKSISVVETICADGFKLNSLFVLHGGSLEDLATNNHGPNINNQALFEIYADNDEDVINDSRTTYTSAELSMIWLRRFNRKTKAKAQNGQKMRVLVCNYNTCHVTLQFLKYCMKNNIVPLLLSPYLSSTLQPITKGLMPTLLKNLAIQLKIKFLANQKQKKQPQQPQQQQAINTGSFLKIYNDISSEVFDKESIRQAFVKTGIWPHRQNQVLAGWDKEVFHQEFDFIDLQNSLTSILDFDLSSVNVSNNISSDVEVGSHQKATSQGEITSNNNNNNNKKPLDPHLSFLYGLENYEIQPSTLSKSQNEFSQPMLDILLNRDNNMTNQSSSSMETMQSFKNQHLNYHQTAAARLMTTAGGNVADGHFTEPETEVEFETDSSSSIISNSNDFNLQHQKNTNFESFYNHHINGGSNSVNMLPQRRSTIQNGNNSFTANANINNNQVRHLSLPENSLIKRTNDYVTNHVAIEAETQVEERDMEMFSGTYYKAMLNDFGIDMIDDGSVKTVSTVSEDAAEAIESAAKRANSVDPRDINKQNCHIVSYSDDDGNNNGQVANFGATVHRPNVQLNSIHNNHNNNNNNNSYEFYDNHDNDNYENNSITYNHDNDNCATKEITDSFMMGPPELVNFGNFNLAALNF